ncbi:RNA-binding protein [Sulfolobales archaeon HS-7]|nr:RNA-binding protein [Sulfolobales archaeon HS-7]
MASEKDKRKIQQSIKEKYGLNLEGKLEIGKEKKQTFYIFDGSVLFFSEEMIPLVCTAMKYPLSIGYVTVDEGAAKALIRGADLFAPGIRDYQCKCLPGEIILAKYNDRPLSILRVVPNAPEVRTNKKGKFAENIHHISDELWNSFCRGSA